MANDFERRARLVVTVDTSSYLCDARSVTFMLPAYLHRGYSWLDAPRSLGGSTEDN